MIDIMVGSVIEIVKKLKHKTIIRVKLNNDYEGLAINYNKMTGNVNIGDDLLINTTAENLKLGTGGYHFVIYNLNTGELCNEHKGHIMKLRYTPYQLCVMSAEEQNSQYHSIFNSFRSLEGTPVIVCSLHSMLVPIVSTLKYLNTDIKIAYIMTDGAGLPIHLSDTVNILTDKNLINGTITIGHAFGGDLEAVNIYNGLIAAKEIIKCDVIVVSMGPGIVGTGTRYGFSGIEQGHILDAVNDLGGMAIGVPRISFSDQRERHYGISHHSLTVFDNIVKTKCTISLYQLEEFQYNYICQQIENLNLNKKHNIVMEKKSMLKKALHHFDLTVRTMGRNFNEDAAYFLTCSASSMFTYKYLSKGG
ncbi:DUF3866 family protein [Serpentinicella sp. ANB-PHB4]|uniref:DUF3866 family protein n=1 Tax=Serpentinicella sp. ANB-PHB4 TaxID=3074076 RepID=UPI00285D3B1A|nr:DUF3866 family protein [Serpentinicella sp. ANB-PHB4]MDR5658173.1 DUF3866 family protein [Serpentinicella sp. ANB-PHB4]